ncbi:chromosome segregation protein SMC [Gloeocapsopsis dulcis]|uniref:Chromosome partition protein Smc n=1 Tax=Gloeocapsopsis dulcis AAB1 = 1H9 TaxID=1433147 RepID=A0A6N8FR67_9CHRO|nr:chromosome segregation protein SMC [Gloeocapsopsis dulcis]MUL35389.1 chromosome segregation protein SMC [Gloeocapsopsis dulcis AAB1 = 1H9]WNN90412.1 chromosome segregation protein SMC [Gloeocapsopsis dulcis]
MVHIKRLELSNFKSFGGTTQIPLLPEFTVVSGPNGSGKSNILDALLFGLGLASSKGMRAERLPDLVNHTQATRGRTVEASVTVTFDLEGLEEGDRGLGNEEQETEVKQEHPILEELSVTRKLRVTQQGTYTSTYYINGEACTLTELHEQLSRLRIYPEGYNVVLQGDVTGIISMNSRERREIIDELAGVAAFDRKITQAKETLDQVKDREERCQIVEQELIAQRDRLSQDRIKAEKYQQLRSELQQKSQWEVVLVWRSLQNQQEHLATQIQAGDRTLAELAQQHAMLTSKIQQVTTELEQLNRQVKALGEEELLKLQSHLATQEAEYRQLKRQHEENAQTDFKTECSIQQKQSELQEYYNKLGELNQEQSSKAEAIVALQAERDAAQHELEQSREAARAIADAADVWVQQQTALNREIEALLQATEPQSRKQAQLRERTNQLQRQLHEQKQTIDKIEPEIAVKQQQLAAEEQQAIALTTQVETLAQSLTAAEQELQIQQDTFKRLLAEQRDKQRQLDKLEAQTQALQETQGTNATKVILQSGLSGVCGLVAQLGRIEPRYQLALETAAGARLGQLVVEDDAIAATAIEILKQKRAGRATFLPLNKIQPLRFSPTTALRYAEGFVNYAIDLIECDRRYRDVFGYVFGSTVVFTTLDSARKHLGQYRIVTLEGELLETSGAMTGGSINQQRSGLHFGKSEAAESDEAKQLMHRLQEIALILKRCESDIEALTFKTKHLSQELTEIRQQRREHQLRAEQLRKEIEGLSQQLTQTESQLRQTEEQLNSARSQLEVLDGELPSQEAQLQQKRQLLAELEQSQTNSQWQQIQTKIKSHEQHLQERLQTLLKAEQRHTELANAAILLQGKITECQQRIQEYQQQQSSISNQQSSISTQSETLATQIAQTQEALQQIEDKLGAQKQLRDRTEVQLRDRQNQYQQLEWQQQKLQEAQQTCREDLKLLQAQIHEQMADLPNPLPEVPNKVDLEQLQREVRSLTKRLQALEPVNMLALEEYERTTTRLAELSQKLLTLEAERTELLLRIENFTTLRQRAFKEAFDAVNQNFQSIFATLSDGDGYLQLDDPEDPFNSGLNLVAHPKGKPVQRLASMSGGEKSLTALSFIFALQRYRPSPFYAFDEVDMFLDGANVERLAKMIKQQAQLAQFIVVSLRRPMIESAERTIGVTQARGAYTQVLGIKLQQSNTSS